MTTVPKKVIVVGAGLAGLAAAFELTEAGHMVTVLEARMRPGGRVHTLREPFADDLYAEAGEMSFTTGYKNLLRYAKLLNIPEGRIHFAGEHTSVLAVTMEGALESGVRAARQIHKAVES